MSVLEDSDLASVQAEDKCYQKYMYIVTWILFILQMVFWWTLYSVRTCDSVQCSMDKSLVCDLPVPGVIDHFV